MSNKILIAAGGTGGHLFPAQALAKALLEKDQKVKILFSGAGLASNPYFQKEHFSFKEVSSSTPFTRKLFKRFSSFWTLAKGIKESWGVIADFQPDLVVGFGSFHSFPLLAAALCKRVPFVLFESNTVPGKVNRLFSRWAQVSATQFSATGERLFGKAVEVNMPLWKKENEPVYSPQEARRFFSLEPEKTTLLVFGGSQGALAINALFCEAASRLKEKGVDFQVIHLIGKKADKIQIENFYKELGVAVCVKVFEEQMPIAWRAASFAICRSGAATLAEQIAYAVPALLIPYPYGNDDHQMSNAKFMAENVGGALVLSQEGLDAAHLVQEIEKLMDSSNGRLDNMQKALTSFKRRKERGELSSLIAELLQRQK